MADFPRTIIGINWFLGYSHISEANNRLIKCTMTPDEARGLIDTSGSLFERRSPRVELQRTRSKVALEGK